MTDNTSGILAGMAEASLQKCLGRLSKVSAGTWEISGIAASRGTIEDAVKRHDFKNPAASAVYLNIAELPLLAMMLFDPDDMENISNCFMGYSFARGPVTTQAEEMMLLELANIVLNSLINSSLNALKKCAMPSVPVYLEGNAVRLLAGLGAVADLKKNFHIIAATLVIRSKKGVSRSEVLALIPEELALEPGPAK